MFGIRKSARWLPPGGTAKASGVSSPPAVPPEIPDSRFMSAPAQKPRPAPVRMIPRTAWSAEAACIAARSSCDILRVQALSLSGRFSVTVAMPSRTSYRMCS